MVNRVPVVRWHLMSVTILDVGRIGSSDEYTRRAGINPPPHSVRPSHLRSPRALAGEVALPPLARESPPRLPSPQPLRERRTHTVAIWSRQVLLEQVTIATARHEEVAS